MNTYALRERHFGDFFEVPFHQYGAGSPYTSPFRSDLARLLDGRRNPAFASAADLTWFTVRRAGVPVGRITAHIHRAANEREGLARGSFGFFDCAPDAEAARFLLDAAAGWLTARGCVEMMGNFNLTAQQEMGVVVAGHDRAPFLAQHHNPPWIPELLREHGFGELFPMTTWRVDVARVRPDALLGARQRSLLDDTRFTVEPIVRRRFRSAMAAAHDLLNRAFDPNPFFVPLTDEQFRFQAAPLLLILDPRISVLARFEGEPCGVIACVPDVNPFLRATRSRLRPATPAHYLRHRLRRTRASIVFGAVRPDLQDRGLAGLMLARVLAALEQSGYEELGVTWVSDGNPASLRQMEKLGAERWHRLALFRRPL